MNAEDIANRIRVCLQLGMESEAVSLIREHSGHPGLPGEFEEGCRDDLLPWLFYASVWDHSVLYRWAVRHGGRAKFVRSGLHGIITERSLNSVGAGMSTREVDVRVATMCEDWDNGNHELSDGLLHTDFARMVYVLDKAGPEEAVALSAMPQSRFRFLSGYGILGSWICRKAQWALSDG